MWIDFRHEKLLKFYYHCDFIVGFKDKHVKGFVSSSSSVNNDPS